MKDVVEIPAHQQVSLVAALGERRLCVNGKDNGSKRLFFPPDEKIRDTAKALGETGSGKQRFQKVHKRWFDGLEIAVRGKPNPDQISAFVGGLVVFESIIPPKWDLVSWSSTTAGCYHAAFLEWRLGASDSSTVFQFPPVARIQQICELVTGNRNVLVCGLDPFNNRPQGVSHYLILKFTEPMDALDIDRICYLIVNEAEEVASE